MSGLFSSRIKFPIHIAQIALVVAALGLSVGRIFLPNAPRGRSGTMALGMAAKSLIFIAYQLLTEHVSKFKRWASLKANLILNAMEIVFWAAVVYMTIQSQSQVCIGISCTLGWIIVVVGILVSMLAGYATIISWLDFRHFRQHGVHRGSMCIPLQSNGEEAGSMTTIKVEEQTKPAVFPAAPAHFRSSNGNQYEQQHNNQYQQPYPPQYQEQYQQQYQQQYPNHYQGYQRGA
ncbi:hypothetical protein CCHL11_07045 [Colletotrichum chlorophyti]|uniref:MARVEL domain-containing protein n=1 Tax=Colletotrichum chlorophyti TaxID=708187 RepID=A0A1Q8RC26_9PEZI|nr:hypothetical protein CCHL11_07045 [Colletotrichum chlorophyti]